MALLVVELTDRKGTGQAFPGTEPSLGSGEHALLDTPVCGQTPRKSAAGYMVSIAAPAVGVSQQGDELYPTAAQVVRAVSEHSRLSGRRRCTQAESRLSMTDVG